MSIFGARWGNHTSLTLSCTMLAYIWLPTIFDIEWMMGYCSKNFKRTFPHLVSVYCSVNSPRNLHLRFSIWEFKYTLKIHTYNNSNHHNCSWIWSSHSASVTRQMHNKLWATETCELTINWTRDLPQIRWTSHLPERVSCTCKVHFSRAKPALWEGFGEPGVQGLVDVEK